MLKQILFGGESGLSPLANLGLLLLRVSTGLTMAFAHGLSKVPPSDQLIANTEKLGFPMPTVFAWSAGLSEFLGGIFLALGLFTRVSSFFIVSTMFVAAFLAHSGDPFATKEKALIYMMIGLAFMFKGSGDWSIDSFLRKS